MPGWRMAGVEIEKKYGQSSQTFKINSIIEIVYLSPGKIVFISLQIVFIFLFIISNFLDSIQ